MLRPEDLKKLEQLRESKIKERKTKKKSKKK